MAWTSVEGWSGRVWVSSTGKRTFYIRSVRNGKRYDGISTGCSTLRGALKELERFEADPEAYGTPRKSVVLNEALIDDYATWCEEHTEAKDERWLVTKKRLLRWWMERFDGRPLTSTKLSLILECLEGQASRADRIKALKHLYSWLRQTDLITAAQDPTLQALPVPQSKPEQDTTGVSKVISEDDFRAVLPRLPPVVADVCRVLAGTGCHLSETLRFMKEGRVEERGAGHPLLCFRHKGGHWHRVEVSASVAEAAGRLLKAQAPARSGVYHAVERECRRAGVDPWTPGRFRHTFATNAVNKGIDPALVARSLGHKGSVTTLKFYATTAVAPRCEGGYD